MRQSRRQLSRVEWPTIAVGAAVYGGFGLLTWHHASLPWWAIVALGGFLVAWHGSLQHETVHGHPTRSRALNEALVFPSLWLWLPYRLYRASHLAHHDAGQITDPREDPESYYLTPEAWQRHGWLARVLLEWQNTLPGRLLLGPIRVVLNLLAAELSRAWQRDFSHLRQWVLHALGCALTLGWVMGVCDIPILEYVALYAYPGISLTLLRSFLEHQAHADPAARTVVVEAGPITSLLFLNNNPHALHHAEPSLPWYRLPAVYALRRSELLAANRDYHYPGYAAVLARHSLRPKEPVVHPQATEPA